MNYQINNTHINNIKVGDTVRCKDGCLRTVGKESIKYSKDLGRTLFGDCYRLGLEPVELVTIIKA